MIQQALIILIYVSMAAAVVVQPRLSVALIWFAIWLYPNTAMYGIIPGNVRLDDLFVCFTFVMALRGNKGRIPVTAALGLAVIWFIAQVMGNSAAVIVADQNIGPVVKFVLKAMYVPMTVAILSMTIRTREDVDFCIKSICVAGVAAALLGIATVYWPRRFEMFYIRDIRPRLGGVLDRIESKGIWSRRATGSLGIMATSLVLLNTSLLSMCRWLFGKEGSALKILPVGFCFVICAAGLMHTQTRGAMIAFAVAILWGFMMQKKMSKLLMSKAASAFAMMVLAGSVVLYKPGILKIFTARFTGGTGVTFGEGAEVRMGVWGYLMNKFNPWYLFTGVGMASSQRMYGTENWGTAHNAYLGSFVYTGLFGFLVLVIIAIRAFRLSRQLLDHRMGNTANMMGTYLSMIMVAMLIAGMTIENFQETICMQLFFACFFLSETVYGIFMAERVVLRRKMEASARR